MSEPSAERSPAPVPSSDTPPVGASEPMAAVGSGPAEASSTPPPPPRKGPLSFLSGTLTSAALAWLCLGFSRKVVAYYALHPPHYEARVAQSIATALKTLIVGMSFLATFSFAFVALGLFLVFLRSLGEARNGSPA